MRGTAEIARLVLLASVGLTLCAPPAGGDPDTALVRLSSQFAETVEVFLVDGAGGEFSVGVLRRGENMQLESRLNDGWVLKTTGASKVELGRFTVSSLRQLVTVTTGGSVTSVAGTDPSLPTGPAPGLVPPAQPAEPEEPGAAAILTVINESGGEILVECIEPSGPVPPASLMRGATSKFETRIGAYWRVRARESDVALALVEVQRPEQVVKIPLLDPSASTAPPAEFGARASLIVTNASGEPIVLRCPPVGSQTSVDHEVPADQTWTQETQVGARWLVVWARSGVQMLDLVVERLEHTLLVEPLGGAASAEAEAPKPDIRKPAPPTPPRPARRSVSVTQGVRAFGGWRLVQGDTEMDTDGSDQVPVQARSRLVFTEEEVIVWVNFSCRETSGNGTTYDGPPRSFSVARVGVGDIPAGSRIVGIKARGGDTALFDAVTHGRAHGLRPFETAGTFWDAMVFQVDGRGRADNLIVGVSGRLTIEVEIED